MGFDERVVPGGNECGQVERVSNGGPSTANAASPSGLSAVIVGRRDTERDSRGLSMSKMRSALGRSVGCRE